MNTIKASDVKPMLRIIDQIIAAYSKGEMINNEVIPDGTQLKQRLSVDEVIELHELKELLMYYL